MSITQSHQHDSLGLGVQQLLRQPDPAEYLDELQVNDYEAYFEVTKALCELPPTDILSAFGREVLLSAIANTTFEDKAAAMRATLPELVGMNVILFERARKWCWRHGVDTSGTHILQNYDLTHNGIGDALSQIDLPKTLAESAHEGISLSDKRVSDYSLRQLELSNDEPGWDGYAFGWDEPDAANINYNIWLDGLIGFGLFYKEKPNAVVALGITGGNELTITQIQGVVGVEVDPGIPARRESVVRYVKSRGLAPLDWRKLMIKTTAGIARNLDIEYVGIQPGARNQWTRYNYPDGTPHLTLQSAEKAYDLPAERLGFKKTESNWQKPTAEL